MDFKAFRDAVATRFSKTLATGNLFVVDVTKEQMWDTYLQALAPDDKHFRTRTEHNCSTCRHFIRDVGNVVSINEDGSVNTIWDVPLNKLDPAYQRAARALHDLVASAPIRDVFITGESQAGVKVTRGLLDGEVHSYDHFHVDIPTRFRVRRHDVAAKQGEKRTTGQMLKRALEELTPSAVAEVLDLIKTNSIYRGQEFEAMVKEFRDLQKAYISAGKPANFAWLKLDSRAARIKNTAIGTLLSDLSEGYDVDDAVKSFELKVAPANYKRPTAVVTPKMVENARAAVKDLGLMDSLHRRYATLTDVSVNNVIFADRSVRGAMKGGDSFDALASKVSTVNARSYDKAQKITIDAFIRDVVPDATEINVLFEGRHTRNLVSVVTEAVENSPRMFKWDNPFSWSYVGDLTDSIKERVKAAGGNVTGDVCCRLAWNNHDDLDFHMIENTGKNNSRYTIYYGNRSQTSPNGGRLDVDANAGSGQTRTPVENIFYNSAAKMKDGSYKLVVHQFASREPSRDADFTVEVDIMGEVYTFHGNNPRTGGTVEIAEIIKQNGELNVKPLMAMNSSTVSRVEWGISTNQFHRVNAVMFSPNHWEGEAGIGNKHVFFLIDGCVNSDNARGFYNEFLRSDLDQHRKVLELIGSRQRTDETPNQLSGLGFSLTKKDELIVKVTGAVERVFRVTI